MQRYTITDFQKEFPTDAACLEWLLHYLYPAGVWCRGCNKITKHHRVAKRRSYSCDRCGHHVHPTAGTIYEKSSTKLTLWFYAIYLMASTRCGISAKQLQRELGVTYKTAWRMFHQIRKMLDESDQPLSGQVEVDETYLGGHRHGGKRGRGAPGKTAIVGMVERKGRIIAKLVPDACARTLIPMIQKHISPVGTTVHTDHMSSYLPLKGRYHHQRVNHMITYVQGNTHTNTIEGFWSHLKQALRGIHRAVRPQHLQAYVNEHTFRYNHRNDIEPMFKTFLSQVRSSCSPA